MKVYDRSKHVVEHKQKSYNIVTSFGISEYLNASKLMA